MEETPLAPSPRQIRPSRANKFFSQFKGIIRTRKANDDREPGVYPYTSQIDTNITMKPYMSQPHLSLRRDLKEGQHESELKLPKGSGSSERLPVRDEESAQPTNPSLNGDFPLRTTNPSAMRNSRKLDALPSPPSPHPRSPRTQSPGSMNTGNGRNIDGLPVLMDPSKPLTAVSGAPTRSISPQTFPAQPAIRPSMTVGGVKRPSTAQSLQYTTGAAPKASPLLKLKRSFSQLRLNSYSKQQPDAPSPSPPYVTPPSLGPASIEPVSTGSRSPPLPPIPTQLSGPSESPSILPSSNSHIPPIQSTNTATIITTSNTQPHHIPMATSGALAPMTTHPKPLPHPTNLQRRTPAQPPKLTLAPINHRMSFTIPTELGNARLSPTIITRHTPLPLSNLPTLTPKLDLSSAASPLTRSAAGPSRNSSRTGPPTSPARGGVVGKAGKETDKRDKKATRAQLNSMPALPLQGTGRGVGGREEVDDIEDDDEEEDDETGDEEEDTSRPDKSRSDLLSDTSIDSSSNQMNISATSDGSSRFGQDSHSRSKGFGYSGIGQRQKEGSRSPSSGSSYHSASNEFSSSYPTQEFTGMHAVPLLKQPTPPHAARIHAQNPTSSRTQTQLLLQSPVSSPLAPGSISPTPNSGAAKVPLPEVDISRQDLPSFSWGSPTVVPSATYAAPVADVKGKGKARDFSNSIVIGGGEYQDPGKTPTDTSHHVLFRSGGGGGGGFVGGTATTTATQSSVINPKSSVPQSPTGTLRQHQQQLHHHHHYGGSGAVDYFSAKGSGTAVVSTSATATATATSATSAHSGREFVLPNSYSSRTSNRYSTSFSPTSQVTTPRPGMGGIRTSFVMPGMPTPKRSSTLMLSPEAGTGPGIGGGKYGMPAMYKRASQSLIDLHTIETKEKRRMMEEEVRAEEDEELALMRVKEREKEKKKQREGRMDDEKINEDEEAAEKRDVLGAPTSPLTAHIPSTAMTTTTTMKNQNRLSRASVLRRRRSMPMFDESTEPPPYPSFAPHHPKYKVMPREDEGREKLPPYTNPISLRAIMPRKMEFSAPGVQSKDRKWRRVLCVLEGTVLKIYKCPPGHAGVGVFGEWWEKKVGAGDVSLQPSHAGAVPTIQIETRESRRQAEERRDFERQVQRIMKAEGGDGNSFPDDEEDGDLVIVPTPSAVPSVVVHDEDQIVGARSRSASTTTISSSRSRFANLLKPGKNHGRSKSDVHFNERNTPSPSPRPSLNVPRSETSTPISARSPSPYSASLRPGTAMSMSSSQGGLLDSTSEFTGRATPGSSYSSMRSGSRQQLQQQQIIVNGHSTQQHLYTNRERDLVPEANPEDLIREYTMQQAESGLGNDYTKRKNVIRVRLEGEQFLLQARDVTGVVEWIEALQAATNIALDLDERPMPRGPLFPRRRRRRRPQIAGPASNTGEAGQTGAPPTGGRTVTT